MGEINLDRGLLDDRGALSFQSLSTAGAHTCGVAAGGVAYCWGRNTDGELGDGTTTHRRSPTPVTGGPALQSLVGGYFHTCGVTPAGSAYCWGGTSTDSWATGPRTNG